MSDAEKECWFLIVFGVIGLYSFLFVLICIFIRNYQLVCELEECKKRLGDEV